MRQVTVQDQIRVTQRCNRNMALLEEASQPLSSGIGELRHVVDRHGLEVSETRRRRESDRLWAMDSSSGRHFWNVQAWMAIWCVNR
jgi:hypothetical protein